MLTEVRGHSWVGHYLPPYLRQHLLFTVSYRRLGCPLAFEDSPVSTLPFHCRHAGVTVMCSTSIFLIHCLETQNSSPHACMGSPLSIKPSPQQYFNIDL